MIVLLARPVRSASSAKLSGPSPCRNAVSTAKARPADGTTFTVEVAPCCFGTRQRPTAPAIVYLVPCGRWYTSQAVPPNSVSFSVSL